MSIFMLRHRSTDWNMIDRLQGRTDICLNQQGCNEIQTVSLFLEHNMPPSTIISSPLSRARQTALIVKKICKFTDDIIIDERFIERSFGRAEGMTQKEIRESFPNNAIPDMESDSELFSRVISALRFYLDNQNCNENILVITHGAVLKVLSENQHNKYEINHNSHPGSLFEFSTTVDDYELKRIDIYNEEERT